MNITLSKRGDYVMRSAIALARAYDKGTGRKIREVVAETEVPQTFASQVLADLVRAGLARSRAGRDGGYWLVRPPREISVLEVIEAAEGPLQAERCALGAGPCRWDRVCPLHETWSQVAMAMRDLLARTSLEEVAERDRAIEAGTYPVPADAHRSHPRMLELRDVVQVELGEDAVHRGLARSAAVLGPLVGASLQEYAAGQQPSDRGPASPAAPTHNGRRKPPASGAPSAEASLVPIRLAGRAARGLPREPGAGEPAAHYLLAWRVDGAAHASRFEAGLSVMAVDAERTELLAEGTWRQDAGSPGLLAGPELEYQARRTLRIFLRRLARLLEEQAVARPRA
jgi:Rrf2 family protein